MKALVTVKETIDYQVKVQVEADGSGVKTDGVQTSINPFDAIALEAVISRQEAGEIAHSTAINIGLDDKVLRQALAMGADDAVQITQEATDPFQKCALLAEYVKQNQPDIIVLGKLAIDGDHSQIPQMLAGMLDWPCATFASDIRIKDGLIEVDRETDTGIETVSLSSPCVISVDLRLNEPRFIALPKLLAAKQQTIATFEAPLPESMIHTETVTAPPEPKGCQPSDNLDAFIESLKSAGVIK